MFVHGKHAIATQSIRARAFNYRTIAQHFTYRSCTDITKRIYITQSVWELFYVLALNEVAPAFDA